MINYDEKTATTVATIKILMLAIQSTMTKSMRKSDKLGVKMPRIGDLKGFDASVATIITERIIDKILAKFPDDPKSVGGYPVEATRKLSEKHDYICNTLSAHGISISAKPTSSLALASGVLVDTNSDTFWEVTDRVASTLVKELTYYKDHISPLINDFSKSIMENTVQRLADDEEVKVYVAKIPDIIKYMAPDTPTKTYGVSGGITIPMVDDIKKILFDGTKSIKSTHEMSFIEELGVPFFERVWDKYIVNLSVENKDLRRLLIQGRPTDKDNELYALYVLLYRLLFYPIEVGVSKSRYIEVLMHYKSLIEGTILRKVNRLKGYYSSGLCVINSEKRWVLLTNRGYALLRSDNNITTQAISAISLTRGAKMTSAELSKTAHELEDTWVAHVFKLRLMASREREIANRAMFINEGRKFNSRLAEYKLQGVVNVDDLNAKYGKYITVVGVDIVKSEPQEFAKKYIVEYVLSHTNAKAFFGSVDRNMDATNNLSLSKAITFSFLDLIIDYYVNGVKRT